MTGGGKVGNEVWKSGPGGGKDVTRGGKVGRRGQRRRKSECVSRRSDLV